MEPRRIAIAVVLMAAILVLAPILFPSPKPVPGALKNGVTDSAAVAAARDSASRDSGTRAVEATPPAVTPAAAGVPGAAAQATIGATDTTRAANVVADTTAVQTAKAVFRTSGIGAALIGAEMRDFKALGHRGRATDAPVELARSGDRLVSFRLVTAARDTVRFDQTVFRVARTESNGRSNVRYEGTVKDHPVAIEYSFLPDSYRVSIAATVGNADNAYLLLDLPPGFHSSEADSVEDANHLAYAYKQETRAAAGVAFRSLDPGESKLEQGPLTWVVAKNKYFLLGVLTPVGAPGFAELHVVGGVRATKQATRAQATIVTQLKAGAAAFDLYVGPQEFKRLVAVGREFETSNPYGGWLQGIVQPFATMVIKLLLWMKSTIGLSYGWILVLFGVTVRILLWPLNQKAMRTSMAMQRIQPELQAIQTKYKGDPQKLQAAMMQVYKEHGMSPFSSLSGCLPMLIPLPVFFALFFVFQNTIEFRGVPFLWLPDISIKDPFYILPIFVAITAMALSWIGMKGVKANDQQKIMMYMMPAMMLLFFFNMASGLNLYYLVQNLASLPQQWLIAHERGKATAPLVRG